MKYSLLLCCNLALGIFSQVAMAVTIPAQNNIKSQSIATKSAVEVGEIATAISVEIKSPGDGRTGSGVLLLREGEQYTVLTAAHVVQGSQALTIKTPDGTVHQITAGSIRPAEKNLDLAVVKFRSSKSYTLAKLGTSNTLKLGSSIYVAGFPASTFAVESGIFNFTRGEVIGNATKGNSRGYSLLYSNITRPGMSGGPVLNEVGELVAIHGQGDREGKEGEGEKTGRNLGIVVERFGPIARNLGVQLTQPVATLPTNQSLNASDYFLRANEKSDRGDIPGALADLNQAIALNPKYDIAYNNRGLIQYKQNNWSQALADYNQALAINPKNDSSFNNRGLLKIEKTKDYPGALADLNRAIALNANNSNAFNNRGYLKYLKNDATGSMADYNQSIAIDPKNHSTYNNRGVLKYVILKDISGAMADYNKSLALNPKYPNPYNNRAAIKKEQNDFNGALADYSQAIALNPNDADFYINRAALKDQLNDFEGAISDYSRALVINPNNAETLNDRGVMRDKANDISGALQDYNQAIALNPKYAKAHGNRGVLKAEKLNDISGGMADYNQALVLAPQDYTTYNNRGFLKYKQGDLAAAMSDYNRAISINPKYPSAFNNRSLAKYKQNDLKGAVTDLDQAIIFQPTFALAYYNRGYLKANILKDKTGGIQDLRQAVRLYRTQKNTGGVQEAIGELRKLGATE
jgi:tetratricopeptide (TPR) repeat protein/V8-like Glu-specific endopeptidase